MLQNKEEHIWQRQKDTVMDWHSRYVISWELSVTMADDFCVSALRRIGKEGDMMAKRYDGRKPANCFGILRRAIFQAHSRPQEQ